MAKTQIVKRFDIKDHFLAIVFGKSSSQYYPTAVKLAQAGSAYYESGTGNSILHLAAFTQSSEGLSAAIALFDMVNGWRGVKIFARGNLVQSKWRTDEVIRCLGKALRCTDWRAHCQRLWQDPSERDESSGFSGVITLNIEDHASVKRSRKKPSVIIKWLLPCSFIESSVRLQKGHPSSPVDQLQAIAVDSGSDWCPLFKPDDFKQMIIK